jgi:hypothetical protein
MRTSVEPTMAVRSGPTPSLIKVLVEALFDPSGVLVEPDPLLSVGPLDPNDDSVDLRSDARSSLLTTPRTRRPLRAT